MVNGEKPTGLFTKIENSQENYIQYGSSGTNGGSFRYYDALELFYNMTINKNDFNPTNSGTMDSTYYPVSNNRIAKEGYDKYKDEFANLLSNMGISADEINNIWKYMNDTLIKSTTIAYPELDYFVLEDVDGLPEEGNVKGYPYLYIKKRDQSRNVDFGIKLRTSADLWISKDLYKTTLLVNGKKQEYMYNKKKSKTDSEGNWIIDTGDYVFNGPDNEDRANNPDYNSGEIYKRELRKSEYLYDGSDVSESDIKNLQVFVTYKIAIKNQSQDIWTSVDELVDYYDGKQYNYFDVADNSIVKDNTFLGDSKGNKKYEINISKNSIYSNIGNNIIGLNDYTSLYITGIKDTADGNEGNVKLRPGDITYLYITFKVNNDPDTGKVFIDQDINELLQGNVVDTVGKKNIVEINGYSTTYVDGTKAGVIDLDSNPGSLKPRDIDPSNGNIISSTNSWENRLEDDTDKASNLKLVIDTNDADDMRSFSGYVFEDARTEVSDQAVIGNGVYNPSDTDVYSNSDKKINGVTVQLVELVQEVDGEGFSTGNYIREHTWSSMVYQRNGSNWTDLNAGTKDPRYYSGTDKSKVILSGQGVFAVNPSSLTQNEGEYRFDSLPPGDFFIRFIYGDTTQTVLTNTENEAQGALSGQSIIDEDAGILGSTGLNSISYTGQDYKSTIYQKGVNQSASANNYNGIIGYVNTELQNYNMDNANDKASMYNYDIVQSNIENISDAKDVYSFREKEMAYSMGSEENSAVEGLQTLKNHRAEVLASATQLTTKAKYESASAQIDAIKELINNTKMVAQTGVIKAEVEYNRDYTDVYTKNEEETVTQYVQNLGYHLQDIDLGLTERPEAQLQLSKELANIQIRLANDKILFDTNQSVNNLIYGKHNQYTMDDYYVEQSGGLAYRLRHDIEISQKERQEELVYAYMDEELMSGAKVRLTYKISIDNIGEVDYLDKNFYYLGKTANPGLENISKTNARRVIDYITNEVNYDVQYQNNLNSVEDWNIITTSVILGNEEENEDNDLVNIYYKDNLNTFNVLLTTNRLAGELIPRAIDTTDDSSLSRREISLVLSTLIANTMKSKNLIYTNLAEILETTNTSGRRMQLSRVGNQPMPYQSSELSIDESTEWIHPEELDSDSAQKVQITVPTGENRAYNRIIVIVVSCLGMIIIAICIIKKKILNK